MTITSDSSFPRSPKVSATHLQPRAYVYVRQSSPTQLHNHKEGRENQYALTGRAVQLGWPESMVFVIDSDLGLSGQSSDTREGFKELVGEVSLGHVGIVLCYEASRLARNNADWYALLDLCALRGTLIADTDGVYDNATECQGEWTSAVAPTLYSGLISDTGLAGAASMGSGPPLPTSNWLIIS